MQTLPSLQVVPAAADNTTYYVAMQPVTQGRTNYEFAAGGLTYNPSTGTLTVTNLSVANTSGMTVPQGPTGDRAGIPTAGTLRFNSTTKQFEGYNGSYWSAQGGTPNAVTVNSATVTASQTIPAGSNGFSVGPLTLAAGVTISLPTGSRHIII